MERRVKDWTLDRIEAFDDIIDVRSPSEFCEDHIPGAINLPVLDDAQRHEVGVLYARAKHEAKKVGAALVAENIAAHLRGALSDKTREWTPLVYCWRGGDRSAAMAHILHRVGWKVACLDGGYKTYRRLVRKEMERVADGLRFRVLCGKTGTGKSRLLAQLAAMGAQVLDLEKLANHRGSVLGEPLAGSQPTQKFFDSLVCRALRRMDAARVIYVEAESRRIGGVQLPTGVMTAMRAAPCVLVEVDKTARVEFLMREYRHFIEQPQRLKAALNKLTPFVGRATIDKWLTQCTNGDAEAFVHEVLDAHYDPIYLRSMRKNFSGFGTAAVKHIERSDDTCLKRAATEILGDE